MFLFRYAGNSVQPFYVRGLYYKIVEIVLCEQ